MEGHFTSEIILLVVAAFIGGFIARSIKLPPIVGYLVSGIIFGVVGRNFIPSFQDIFEISQIGVSLLLFTLGFEVSLSYLLKINKKVIFAGVMQIILTSLILFPLLLLFRFPIPVSFLFALLFSSSSTAVVLKLLEERGMLNNFPGNNVFVMLLIQDLFIVPILFLIPIIFSDNIMIPSLVDLAITMLKPILAFGLMFLFSKLFLNSLFKIFFKYPSQELTILATIFTAVASIGLLTFVGLPETVAAFFAGILISDEKKNLAPMTAISPLRDVLLVLFFVLVGMLVDGRHLLMNLPMILGLTLAIISVKFLVVFFVLRFLKFLPSANIFIASHLSNVGEFAVVIGQVVFFKKYITSIQYENLLSVFIISLVSIPIIIKIAKKIHSKYQHLKFVKLFMGESHYFSNPTLKELNNHVIICGHGRVGREVRNMLDMAAVPYIVIDYSKSVVNDLEKNMKNALYGDPTDIETLKMASIKKAKILVVTVPDSFTQKVLIKIALKMNPDLVVLCRSHIDEDKYELVNLGVNTIVMPEFEAGLRIGKKVLELLSFNDNETYEMLKKLRKFHLVH